MLFLKIYQNWTLIDSTACAGTTNTFANTTHPRTVVGFKEDGSTVLMVANGRAEKNEVKMMVKNYINLEL